MVKTEVYLRHEVELESHGNDVESNDAGDAQVKVLASDDSVQQ